MARMGKKRKAYRFVMGIVNVKMFLYTTYRRMGTEV
jgi:hypothetical protein